MDSIARVSITDKAISEIKKYLLSGCLSPGDKILTEKEFSEQLGVGRSTVREAIMTLKAMGYVELRPGKGAFAVITSTEEEKSRGNKAVQWFIGNETILEEFQQARYCLEPFAASLAAQNISDRGIEKLCEVLDHFDAIYAENNIDQLSVYDEVFHVKIFKESGNSLLFTMYKQLMDMFRQYSAKSFSLHESIPSTIQEHRKILKAIAEHDAVTAERVMRAHIESSIDRMNRVINGRL